MIDCSHGNSLKDYRRQADVAASIAEQISAGSRQIFGAMLESHLVEGRQDLRAGQASVYGQSITDACISLASRPTPAARAARAAQQTRRARRA
jgi:3-deoxy-7-phosphoheptulonate synthase